ncbi:MAG: hypothetical protein CVT88_09310 [Candidatus Altiarchaeales archaeon HGW-Altiarchaeales-1]|nr:MAG: hypothetical protein CVT88_09310 [Candidatus Altiarchaeales archaeon HGW-Altiarchaeales-1]
MKNTISKTKIKNNRKTEILNENKDKIPSLILTSFIIGVLVFSGLGPGTIKEVSADYNPPGWGGGGSIYGYPPDAWVGDGPDKKMRSGVGTIPPKDTDVDFVKINGEWWKIAGPVYIDDRGKIWGLWPPKISNVDENGNPWNWDSCINYGY